MAEAETKVPVRTEKRAEPSAALRPFESLRREINRVFDDFHWGGWPFPAGRTVFDLEPFRRSEISWGSVPTVDIAEKDGAYEVTAELPRMDENNVEVNLSDGMLTIKGEKKRRRRKRKRITTCQNAAMARSTGRSGCRTA